MLIIDDTLTNRRGIEIMSPKKKAGKKNTN
jgi:hypothetical protein